MCEVPMKLRASGFEKFHCAWCESTRGGLLASAIGYRCENPACGFLCCDNCVKGVGFMGRVTGNVACPRCGNPAERAVN
jgi:hypothetical protein